MRTESKIDMVFVYEFSTIWVMIFKFNWFSRWFTCKVQKKNNESYILSQTNNEKKMERSKPNQISLFRNEIETVFNFSEKFWLFFFLLRNWFAFGLGWCRHLCFVLNLSSICHSTSSSKYSILHIKRYEIHADRQNGEIFVSY